MLRGRPQAPPVAVGRWVQGVWERVEDVVAAEEPLQLALNGDPLSVVMRTPGNDIELALGLLWAERVITSLDQVELIRVSAESGETEAVVPVLADAIDSNLVDVHLVEGAPGRRPERSFLSSSACGVCGATTVESLTLDFAPLNPGPVIDPAIL